MASKKVKIEVGSIAATPVAAGDTDVKTCFVGNMSFDLDEDNIWAAFDEWIGAGSVVSVRLITDHSGRPKGNVLLYSANSLDSDLSSSLLLSRLRVPSSVLIRS
jgi:hypothetical protein